MDIITIFLMGLLGGIVGSVFSILVCYYTIRNTIKKVFTKYNKVS